MEEYGGQQQVRDQQQQATSAIFEEKYSLEDLLGCDNQQQTADSNQPQVPVVQQQQQQQQQHFVSSLPTQRNLSELQSQSRTLLNNFASELLAGTDFHTGVADHNRILDVTNEFAAGRRGDGGIAHLVPHHQHQAYQDLLQVGGGGEAATYHQLQVLPPPRFGGGHTSVAHPPSPSVLSSTGAECGGQGSGSGSDAGGSPGFPEDFDEMALIPETLASHPLNMTAHKSTGGTVAVGGQLLCPVCGNKAGKHSYYGGQVCNSCRAFFRRSVQNKSHPNFKCKKESKCEINSRSWKACQACRFSKCLSAGMKASWVLTEPERKERAKQRAETKRKKLEQRRQAAMAAAAAASSASVSTLNQGASAGLPRPPDDLFTEEDRTHTLRLIDTTFDFLTMEMCKFYSRHHSAFDEVLSTLYKGSGISQDTQRMFENFVIYSVKNFYRGMGDMMHLSSRDQNNLVSKNYPMCMEFFGSIFIESQDDCQKITDQLVTQLRELPVKQSWAGRSADIGVLEDKFNKVNFDESL